MNVHSLPKPDLDSAVAFLRALRDEGPWNVSAIAPDGRVTSATFTDPKKLQAWLAKRVASANLYYQPNPASKPTGNSGRAQKVDIDPIAFLHVDIDLDKLSDDRSLDDRKADALAGLVALDEPSFVVDSGGGHQAIWRLREPLPATPENIAMAEAAGRWLIQQFGGDSGTHNVDRLLRLPGTINYPNETKKARGRVVAPTRLVHRADAAYGLDDFGRVEAAPMVEVDTEFGPPEEVLDIDALIEEYSLPERLGTIIVAGRDEERPKPGDDSDSAWLLDATMNMLRAGVPPEVVMGVLLNSEWGISRSVYDPEKNGGRTPEAYALRQVKRALGFLEAERRADAGAFDEFPTGVDDNQSSASGQQEQPGGIDWDAWLRDNWVDIGKRDLRTIPPTPWLQEGLLLYGDVTTIGGRGGSGKSLLAWQIVCSIATGRPLGWWPAPKRARRVLVISGEDDVDEIERRVSAACQAMGIQRSDLGDNFKVWNRRTIRLALKDDKGKVTLTELRNGMRWAVENLDVGLIVVDPLIKGSSGFDESSNDDMEELYTIVREIIVGHECAALTVDHFAKSGTGGDQASIRGASAKVDAARVAITLTGMTEEEHRKIRPRQPRQAYVLCVDAKQNYARKSGGHWMELVDFEVGNGERRPSLIWRDLEASADEFYDPQHWPHREQFLQLVADGYTKEGDKESRPWSAAGKGARKVRLNAAVATMFDLSDKLADAWIEAFSHEGSIVERDWESPNRTTSKVWMLNPDYQTEEDTETEALRE